VLEMREIGFGKGGGVRSCYFCFAGGYINYVGKVEGRHCCRKVALDLFGRVGIR
jgi:hypothetical protein